MAESEYGHLIVTQLKPNIADAPWAPPMTNAGKGKGGRMMWLDNEVVPDAFYMEVVWIYPRPAEDLAKMAGTTTHTHDYDEVIALFGSDLNDPYDMGAEAEVLLGDEKHLITKSCLVFVPKGLKHGLRFNRIDRPIFHFTTGPGHMYF